MGNNKENLKVKRLLIASIVFFFIAHYTDLTTTYFIFRDFPMHAVLGEANIHVTNAYLERGLIGIFFEASPVYVLFEVSLTLALTLAVFNDIDIFREAGRWRMFLLMMSVWFVFWGTMKLGAAIGNSMSYLVLSGVLPHSDLISLILGVY